MFLITSGKKSFFFAEISSLGVAWRSSELSVLTKLELILVCDTDGEIEDVLPAEVLESADIIKGGIVEDGIVDVVGGDVVGGDVVGGDVVGKDVVGGNVEGGDVKGRDVANRIGTGLFVGNIGTGGKVGWWRVGSVNHSSLEL